MEIKNSNGDSCDYILRGNEMGNISFDIYYAVEIYEEDCTTGVVFTFDDLESAEEFMRLCISNDYSVMCVRRTKER